MSRNLNEHSPLIGTPEGDAGLDQVNTDLTPLTTSNLDDYAGLDNWSTSQLTKSSSYLFLLTVVIGGLQICWSVELAYGSPYLISLGLSKALLAFVWIAGPLTGSLVQPWIGFKSDRCRSKWGKRRPFMVIGGLATMISLLCLAWAREIASVFLGIFGVAKEDSSVHTLAIIIAVVDVYVLDFAINAIQAAARAFIVDMAPAHQQNDANAWASRISGVGNILGYLSGYTDLPSIMPFFGNTQFKILCVIACIALSTTTALTCSIGERDASHDRETTSKIGGVFGFFVDLYHSMMKLPLQIKKVCQVQFFAWMGWFPFLFYTTTFIAGIYADPFFRENPNMTPEEIEQVWGEGTRLASFSLLIFACTTLTSSIILPLIIQPTFQAPTTPTKAALAPTATTPGGTSGPGDYFSRPFGPRSRSGGGLSRFRWILPPWRIPGLTLRRLYIASNFFFTLLMCFTPLVHSPTRATILVAFIGIPWSLTHWAPFAIIAAEVGKRDAIRRGLIKPAANDRDAQLLAEGEDPSDGADQAGIVLGIHNIAVAAPQIIATLVSSLIFKLLQKPRGQPDDDSVGWVLRCGGLATIVAGILAFRIHEESG